MGYAVEGIARTQAADSEQAAHQVDDGARQAAAARHVDGVDLTGTEARVCQHLLQIVADGVDVERGHLPVVAVGQVGFELQTGLDEAQVRAVVGREGDFRPFDFFEEGVDVVVVYQHAYVVYQRTVVREDVVFVHHPPVFGVFQQEAPLPVAQFAVQAVGHFYLLAVGLILDAAAQQGRHFVPHDFGVEQVAPDVESAVGQDVAAAVGLLCLLRGQADDAEVGRTASEVGHEYGFFVLQMLLVGQGGGDGFELQVHFLESGVVGGCQQSGDGGFLFLLLLREDGGPTQCDLADGVAEVGFGLFLQGADDVGGHLVGGDFLAVDPREQELVLLQQGLDRLQQAAFHGFGHVLFFGLTSDVAGVGFGFGEVEDGLQRGGEDFAAGAQVGDGYDGVGGAEVESARQLVLGEWLCIHL